MTFGDSIRICFTKYADFKGRATRSEFWWFMLFIVLVSVATSILSDVLSGLFSLAVLLPSVAVSTRRLHDVNRSGWWQLVGLIPVIGWILVIYWCAQEGSETSQFN